MSSGANNFRPALANWHAARGSAARTSSNHDEPNMFAATSRSLQLIPDVGAGALIPWRPSEERMRTGPSGALIPWRPPEERTRTGPSGALAGRFPGGQLGQMSSPTPGFTGQLGNLQEKSRLTRDDKASKKLRKEIYNPSPKRITRRLNLYYRDNASNSLNEVGKKEELEEDGKRCPICWEDFEAREEVMLTPCDHMFHEECIMPWVKSNGQCPVCRYAFTDRERETTTTTTSNVGLNNTTNIAYMAASDVLAVELISIIRAMDEALQWG